LLAGVLTETEVARCAGSVIELNRYLAARFAEAQRDPGDDVLGDLVRATREDDEALGEDEVVAILLQLLSAGTESTTALLGSALRLLADNDVWQQRLRSQPSDIAAFVEETVRLESPFQGHFRVTNEDTAIGDVAIARGTRLMLLWGSANRDERVFDAPERIDPHRTNLSQHLGFGIDAHHCIGAALARLEGRITIEEVLARNPGPLRVDARAAQRPDYVHSVMIRRLNRLPLLFARP
jgi:cytochrome P450